MQDWIKKELQEKGGRQKDLADALGLDPPRIGEIIAGTRQIKVKEAARLATFFSIPIEDAVANILGEDLPAQRRPASAATLTTGIIEFGKDEFASLPRYDAAFSAGDGSLIDPNAEPIGHQLIEHQWLRAVTNASPNHLAVVRVDGDSMEHTLSDGDWVLLDRTQQRITREGIYALAVHDSCWIKRVSLNLREKMVRVISDNDRYPVQELPEDELTLIGRVLSVVWRKT